MAYEPSRRSPPAAGYFEDPDRITPDHSQDHGHGGYSHDYNYISHHDLTNPYVAEPRDTSSARQPSSAIPQQRTSPPLNETMDTAPDRSEPLNHSGVSSDLMEKITEQITEKVKKELFEHFKQTGNIEEPKATSMQRDPSNISNSTTSPPPTARRVYTPPSPVHPQSTNSPPMAPTRHSPPSSPLEKPSAVRFTDRDSKPSRPAGASRNYSTLELSTIDKCWGRLFDNEGNPTERLGQILRGLANHIIDEFAPKRSIVIPPSKMATFYTNHKLDKETHRFASVFGSLSNDEISQLYQDLGCQHHLIQDDLFKDPIIPALTPVGFAHWMTICIMAYPEEETLRLQKVVLATPIDADGEMVDGKPERLPKQISRHLLPPQEDRKSRKLLDRAISDFFQDLASISSTRRRQSITSPPPSRPTSTTRARPVEPSASKSALPTQQSKPLERDRMPYVGSPAASESAIIDDAIKIERERQPYTAQPGGGKVRTESINIPPTKDTAFRTRANSVNRGNREPSVLDPRHQSIPSTASQAYTPQSARPNVRRPSSPPLKNFSQSTPNDLHSSSNYGPPPGSSTYSQTQTFSPPPTTVFPAPPPPVDIRDKRVNDERSHHRRATEESAKIAGDFNSPRDAERWDRLQDAGRNVEPDRTDRSYDSRGSVPTEHRSSISNDQRESRPSAPMGPRDPRNAAPYEDYYRERDRAGSRGSGYDEYGSRRY
ncbi:hypothetical protein PVAG01_06584 [Phlyctema vagabunda]|uniref:DUF7514 domain-containing protein n=1 Tax=Phlyctema vagabunda TaxID=108571 RepID=A0ABR4PGH5_9HELO